MPHRIPKPPFPAHYNAPPLLHAVRGYLPLLHIERNWPEQVPQLVGAYSESVFWKLAGGIDNLLEHIVIVPRMAKYGFDPYARWNDEHRSIWIERSWKETSDTAHRDRTLLLAWPTLLHNVTDISLRNVAFKIMRQFGLLPRAERFNEEIDNLIRDKAAACSAALKHLELPAQEFRLAYCDPRKSAECEFVALS